MKRNEKYLWFISTVSAMGGLLFGFDVVVMSGTVPRVIQQFQPSSAELGILVSCVLWGCAVGSALSGFILDRLGRKKVLILSSVIIFISALLSGLAPGMFILILARSLGGVGGGLATSACPLYIAEVAPEQNRGRMVSLYHLSVCLGIVLCVFSNLFIYSLSSALSLERSGSSFIQWLLVSQYWRSMFLMEVIPAAIYLICTFVIPESPRWLMSRNHSEKARRILARINGEVKADELVKEIRQTIGPEKTVRLRELGAKRIRRPLILAIIVCVLSEACGISAVLYYGPHLLEQSGLSLGRSLGGFTVIALVNLMFNLVSIRFMDSVGRKKLLGLGTVGCFLSLVAIGSLSLLGVGGIGNTIPYISFMAFFAFSIGPVKFVIISEIFPNQYRAKAVAIATVCIWLTSALVAQLFPILRDYIPTGAIFLLFAVDVALLFLVDIFYLPETRGRSIDKIDKDLLSSQS